MSEAEAKKLREEAGYSSRLKLRNGAAVITAAPFLFTKKYAESLAELASQAAVPV